MKATTFRGGKKQGVLNIRRVECEPGEERAGWNYFWKNHKGAWVKFERSSEGGGIDCDEIDGKLVSLRDGNNFDTIQFSVRNKDYLLILSKSGHVRQTDASLAEFAEVRGRPREEKVAKLRPRNPASTRSGSVSSFVAYQEAEDLDSQY